MRITGLEIVAEPHEWESGDRLLAIFNLDIAGIQFRDCQLIRGSRTRTLIAQPPRLTNNEGQRCVRFVDNRLRDSVADAAYSMFIEMGGVERVAA